MPSLLQEMFVRKQAAVLKAAGPISLPGTFSFGSGEPIDFLGNFLETLGELMFSAGSETVYFLSGFQKYWRMISHAW